MNPDITTLPEKIRDLLRSDELMIATEQIAAAHELRPEYYGAVYRNTVCVLKGKLEPKDFVNQLVYELDIDREQAIAIAQEVNRDVFNNVREELKNLHGVGMTTLSGGVVAVSEPSKTGPSSFAVKAPNAVPTQALSTRMPLGEKPTIPQMNSVPKAPAAEKSILTNPEARIPMQQASTPSTMASTPIVERELGSMNIFEEKLGNTFRVKSEVGTSAMQQTPMPQNPAKPVAPLQSVIATPPAPKVPAAPMIGVVPNVTPQKPTSTIPNPPVQGTVLVPPNPAITSPSATTVASDPYREVL